MLQGSTKAKTKAERNTENTARGWNDFITGRGQFQTQMKKVEKNNATYSQNQNIETRSEQLDWSERTNKNVQQRREYEMQISCTGSAQPLGGKKTSCRRDLVWQPMTERWAIEMQATTGRHRLCRPIKSGTTRFLRFVSSFQPSTKTKMKKELIINSQKKRVKRPLGSQESQGRTRKTRKRKRKTNQKCQHKYECSPFHHRSLARVRRGFKFFPDFIKRYLVWGQFRPNHRR